MHDIGLHGMHIHIHAPMSPRPEDSRGAVVCSASEQTPPVDIVKELDQGMGINLNASANLNEQYSTQRNIFNGDNNSYR